MERLKSLISLFIFISFISCGANKGSNKSVETIQSEEELDRIFCDANKLNLPYAGGNGSVNNQFIICSVDQFNQISQRTSDHDKFFQLKQNIDFSSTNLNMISSSETGFTGTFDGKNYALKNVSLNYDETDYLGVFKKIDTGGVVKNLSVININIVGGNYVGAITGFSSGIIENCTSSGSISGVNNSGGLVGRNWGTEDGQEGIFNSSSSADITGNEWTGGVVGWSRNVKFENIFSTGNITSGNRSGGLIGVGDGSVEIINSYATGNVVSTGFLIGGLVGGLNGTITNSYSSGSVTATGGYLGGIAGSFKGTISKTYSSSVVTLSDSYVAGGLVGYLYDGSEINNSYFNGVVQSVQDYIGGLVGYNEGSPINFSFSVATEVSGNDVGGIQGGTGLEVSTTSFWDITISGVLGDFIDDMSTKASTQGRTTTDLKTKNTFTAVGYDESIWKIRDGHYPTLR